MEQAMTEKQWERIEEGLTQIALIKQSSEGIEKKIENIEETVKGFDNKITEYDITLYGKNKDNGICGDIKKLKRKTSDTLKTWVPLIISVIMFISVIYMWISTSIEKDILLKQIQSQTTLTGVQNP